MHLTYETDDLIVEADYDGLDFSNIVKTDRETGESWDSLEMPAGYLRLVGWE